MPEASSGSLSRALRTLLSISWADRGLLVEATLRLAAARIALLVLPFRFVSPRLGAPMQETGQDDADRLLLHRVAWAIGAVSRRAPWRCKCLEQGIAAKMMLRRRRLPNTLYLGVARGAQQLEAHAWLRSGTVYVTGGAERERFAVVSTFADEARG
jgi:transglutaminase superfamily protein